MLGGDQTALTIQIQIQMQIQILVYIQLLVEIQILLQIRQSLMLGSDQAGLTEAVAQTTNTKANTILRKAFNLQKILEICLDSS